MGPLVVFFALTFAAALRSRDRGGSSSSFGGQHLPALRRRLTEPEIEELRKVFGDSLPWRELRVRGRRLKGPLEGYVRTPRRDGKLARTVTIDRMYRRESARGDVHDPYFASLGPLPEGPVLVHEMMHLWLDRHGRGPSSESTEREALAMGVPTEELYDLLSWYQRMGEVPFDRWPEEARCHAAAWYWNGLHHDPSDPSQGWYVRLPEIDELFEHVRDRGELPAWTRQPRSPTVALS